MNQKIKKIYSEVYSLFKNDTDKKEYQYVRRSWIFPNHIDVMLDIVKKLYLKYGGDLEVCLLAAILHDVGLVYKRNISSPVGHESRSIEYAEKILKKHKYPESEIRKIVDCIKSTKPESKPKNMNEKITRTADSLSQFKSIHFFAKAAFSQDFKEYVKWLEGKVKKDFQKISFSDEKKEVQLTKEYILKAIKLYYKNNKV